MFISRKWKLLLLIVALICIAPARNVHAYIDPGTGNYLLQIILTVLFGALFALKVFWSKIKCSLGSIRRPSANSNRDCATNASASGTDEDMPPKF